MTPMEFIPRFTFGHSAMGTNLAGTINPTHLQGDIRALLKGPLPQRISGEAKRRLKCAG